jgi:hypothetical protein
MFGTQKFLQEKYGLKSNPFSSGVTYAPEKQDIYEPEMYGHQHIEFREKFFTQPLFSKQPIIGAVWSSVLRGDPETRGYGKSTMMGEETKLLNKDFGLSIFKELGASAEEAAEYPVMAGYVSFDGQNIKSIEAASYYLVKNLVKDGTEAGGSTHLRLRKMLLKRLSQTEKIPKSSEDAAIEAALRKRVRELAIPLEFNGELAKFLTYLCSVNSVGLSEYLAGVTNWHHIRTGVKFLQVYTCFAVLAGIKHVTYFIDQVEDFTTDSSGAKIMKNVKLIRDALLETEPFVSSASFIFQLHPIAWANLRTAWQHENLRDLGTESRQSEPYVVNLQGLSTFELAMKCATTYLNHPKYTTAQRQPNSLVPFTEDAIRYVWDNTEGVPREFIRSMYDLIEHGRRDSKEIIDATYAAGALDPSPGMLGDVVPGRRQKKQPASDSRLT